MLSTVSPVRILKELCRLRRIPMTMAARLEEIRLDEDERAELERVASLQKAPYREVQRAKLILYAADGSSNAEIGRASCRERV